MDTTDQKQPIDVFPKNPILFRFCFLLITLFIILINNSSFFFLLFFGAAFRPSLNRPAKVPGFRLCADPSEHAL